MNQMRIAAEELETLSNDKWRGLIAMNRTLESTFVDSEEARLKAIE